MDLMPTPEQDAIRDSVRAFLDAELPMSRVRALMGAPADAYAELWRGAAALGFFGLGLPEARGGAGYALTEEMVLFEELGRALAPGPWLGTVLAAHALAEAGDDGGGALARAARRRAARRGLHRCRGAVRCALRGERVSGTRSAVLGAGLADAFLVVDDAARAVRAARARGVAVDAAPSLDATNPVGTVTFRDAPCRVLSRDRGAAARLRRAAIVLACADAVGGIARTVEMSVEYAKVRQQFGKPIGSFQAVKHRCADMAVRAEVARSATIYATVSVRDGAADADFQVAVAKVLVRQRLSAERRRQRPEPRRHGLHLGVRRAPVRQARPRLRRHARLAARAARRPGGAVPRRVKDNHR